MVTSQKISAFRKKILSYYQQHGRDLPWRKTKNPYHTFISEIMLQQTQVDRVIPKYLAFITAFPTFEKLAKASLGDVLKRWVGLGYNRRAKFLKLAAEIIVSHYNGKLPSDPELLKELPGIGPATAASLAAFAYNKPTVFLETNVRSVLIHHFFPKQEKVTDTELLVLAEKTLDKKNPARWYNAIMDYGTMLKKTENHTRKSTTYAKQSKFKGSDREIRGKIIRELSRGPKVKTVLIKKIATEKIRTEKILSSLIKEHLIIVRGQILSLD